MRIALALFALTLLPGIPLCVVAVRRLRHPLGWLAVAGAMGMLWSVALTSGLVLARIPLRPSLLLLGSAIPALAVSASPRLRRALAALVKALPFSPSAALVLAFTIAGLALPYFTTQRGLPTGDVQKAIFWAEQIRLSHRLPQYADALRLNRDPADFATPGLHALTAAVIAISGDSYRGPAAFSLAAALILAGLAAAIASMLLPKSTGAERTRTFHAPLFAFLFAATNPRFLRYTAAPGYHYQNLIGEVLLVLALVLLLKTVSGRGELRALLGAGAALAFLPTVHQFTTFLAIPLMGTLLAVLVVRHRGEIATIILRMPRRHRRRLLAGTLIAALAVFFVLADAPFLGKLPHVFTATPHLRPYVVAVTEFPSFFGVPFFLVSAAGALVVLVLLRDRKLEWRWWLLLLWAGGLVLLSQGARWILDIPSARTLFYLTTPLSVFGAVLAERALNSVQYAFPRSKGFLLPVALAALLAPTVGVPLNAAVQTIDHTLQTNSTLTPETLDLLSYLSSHPPACPADRTTGSAGQDPTSSRLGRDYAGQGPEEPCRDAILIDDWNRRRTTWAILSPYRMLTRVGADIGVIAREARQSEQRKTQYETLLDFEKIYTLGNSPLILELLFRHGIALVVGANGFSSDVFLKNPALAPVYQSTEVTVFKPRERFVPDGDVETALLDRTTLANDIGDAEDIFARLPLSVLAPQISEILISDGMTFREIQSSVSSIGLNVGTYVPHLWDGDGNRVVDRAVELSFRVQRNGARGRITRGTKVFATFALPEDGAPHTLRATVPAGDLPMDEQGLSFVTLRLDKGPLRVDWVSARLITLEP